MLALAAVLAAPSRTAAQAALDFRFAVVALVDDAELRRIFEAGVVEKLRSTGFDAVASNAAAPTWSPRDPRLARELAGADLDGALLLRLAGIGEEASLETVRDLIRPEVFRDIERFAAASSALDEDETPAVAHMAIYMLEGREASLITAGATWLEEDAGGRAAALERLQDLVVLNMESARPAIRGRLGARGRR